VSNRWLGIVVVLAGLAGAAGYYLYSRREVPAAVTLGGARPQGVAVPAPPARQLVATVPDFTLEDREGSLRSLHDWPGKSLIVNFWATWCAPCRREIPLLEQIARERADDGFQVVGIAVDFRDKVLEYAHEMKIDYPLLIGEQEGLDAAASFGIDAVGFPFTVFTDAKGRVIAAHLGELTRPEATVILGAVDRVNRGTLDPAAARREIEGALQALPPANHENSTG
jgi:thiol-disulfide isomerase/thioredoxin